MLPTTQKPALLTLNLPSGETLILPVRTAIMSLLNLMTYPLRLSAGYFLFGWRGVLLIAALTLIVPQEKVANSKPE
jgi:hypothetical protein